ncbi:MAG: Crp/Fnr family transcriptional regulator [Deltaproteobacteria bacterium]|nr:MAG: Crp/Fnr family transcriptional regulator [Deltaproteobacteria bacterium]
MGIIEEIASIPLFQNLSHKHLGELSMIVVDQIFKKGQEVFSEGEDGTGFYVIITGRVKIYKVSWEGREQILHIFGPGEPFGEVPVFTGQKFPASAAAIEESRIFFFPKDAFIGLIRREPELALGMLAVLSMRLRRFTQLIEELSLKEVPGRLAAYLLYLSKKNESSMDLELDISKTQLASLLGTIPETLSRILAKMKRRGLIDVDGSRIKILDADTLEDIAEAGGGL